MLESTMERSGEKLEVKLGGRLDTLSALKFDKEIEVSIDGVTELVIDCEKLEYIASAGLRTLLALQQHMEEMGYSDVKLLNVNDNIREILEETGFTDLLNVE